MGQQARFVGEIFGDEDILINGRLEGNVRINHGVTVGPNGDVIGELHAKSVVVAGRVEGKILAQERAELLPSAAVKGSVQAPKVVIAEGARLEGSVAMSAPEARAPGASEKPS
ncbi:MAG: bactofilin family protein [Thermoanaerobaculia bacterium]